MKQIFTSIFLIIILFSCSNNGEKIVTGTLNPNIRGFIDFQTADKIEINNFIKRIDSLAIKNNDTELNTSSKFYHNLLKHKLIRIPSIHLKLSNNTEIKVFINKNQYQKIKQYNYLGSDIQYKIRIKLKYREIDENIFLSDSIIDVDVNRFKN